MPAEETKQAMREGAATFYGVQHGKDLLKKMADHFECQGAGRYGANITATGVIRMLLEGELDVVRVKDGKGYWHEDGYDRRPEI